MDTQNPGKRPQSSAKKPAYVEPFVFRFLQILGSQLGTVRENF